MNSAKNKIKNRRTRKQITVLLACTIAGIWVLFLLLKVIFCHQTDIPFDVSNLYDSFLDNILGILPPIIIFSFAYEHLTRNTIAEEISEQIMQTLMGDSTSMDLFNNSTKEQFLSATLHSMLDHEKGDMVYNLIKPYTSQQYNLKKSYQYTVTVQEYPKNHPYFNRDRYIKIHESLHYSKRYVNSKKMPEFFQVGFFVEDADLDQKLRSQDFIFRECLCIATEDLYKLVALPQEEKVDFVKQQMDLNIFINNKKAEIKTVTVTSLGIRVDCYSIHSDSNVYDIELGFSMPQRKGKEKFLISICEPTFSPMITFTYPKEIMQVTMIPFLNGTVMSKDATHTKGLCKVTMEDEWVMPMSGIVFMMDS